MADAGWKFVHIVTYQYQPRPLLAAVLVYQPQRKPGLCGVQALAGLIQDHQGRVFLIIARVASRISRWRPAGRLVS
ncbi:MAG TPA: hypothetical protein VII28_16365, partial [Puia sp.]